MNVCDTDRYSTTLIFCRTMNHCILLWQLFRVLDVFNFKVVLCGVPWKSWAQRRWLQVSVSFAFDAFDGMACSEDEKTKTAFWQKETWPQGSPRCTFSHRLWGGGHPSEWSRKRVSSMNPLGLQISEQFFDFKHFLSLSATFCFLEVKKYDTFGRTAIQLPEDTKEYEGYMACLKGSPTPPLRPRGHSDGRLWRVFGCCHGRISVGFSVGEHGRAMSVYSVHLSASQCSKDQKPMVFLVA